MPQTSLVVDVIYSRSGLFGEYFPERGGFLAGLRGAPEKGTGDTPEAAVANLAEELGALVATQDLEGGLVVLERSYEHHAVLSEVARAVRRGTLYDDLRAGAKDPVLDAVDEPRAADLPMTDHPKIRNRKAADADRGTSGT